jgi:hypothetical protein
MTTDLSRLSNAVTADSADTQIEGEIRKHIADIREAFSQGRDYDLRTKEGVFRLRKPV